MTVSLKWQLQYVNVWVPAEDSTVCFETGLYVRCPDFLFFFFQLYLPEVWGAPKPNQTG